jgi:hypothetical protein
MVGIRTFYSMGAKFVDLTGRRFERLLVQGISATRLYGKQLAWDCLCDCGKTKVALTSSLKAGCLKSCGCLSRECKPPVGWTHRMSNYSGIKVWEGMIRRCTNPKDKDFRLYGGRGVKVCERWMDVRLFAEDMGDKPQGHSLDRIDTNGDYCPENCRWATAMEQGSNKRTNRMISHNGQNLHMSEWCRRYNIKLSTFINRLKSGMSPSDALTMPLQRKRGRA